MKTLPRCLALALALVWLGCGRAASAQVPIYTANTTTATVQPGAVHFLQLITFAQGPGTYAITKFTFSANFTSSDPQKILLYFYTGVDTDPASTNALAHATIVASESSNYTPPPGNFAFIYNYTTPFLITTDGSGTVGIEIFLVTPDPNDPNSISYSQTANGRFTDSVPTVGASPGYVWNDADLNSVFTGTEQTRFGMTNANYRVALAGGLFPVIKAFVRNGTTATLTVDSFTGFSYQLQRAPSLAGNWTNAGGAVAGSTGTVLTFTDSDGTDPQAFYRLTAVPKAAGGQAASRTLSSGSHPLAIARPD